MHLFHLISCHFVLSGYKKEKRGKWCSIYQLQDERATHEFLTERNRQEKEVKVTVIQVLVLFLSRSFFLLNREWLQLQRPKNMGRTLTSGWIHFVTVFLPNSCMKSHLSRRLTGLCSFFGFVSRPLYSWYEEVLRKEGLEKAFFTRFLLNHFPAPLAKPFFVAVIKNHEAYFRSWFFCLNFVLLPLSLDIVVSCSFSF